MEGATPCFFVSIVKKNHKSVIVFNGMTYNFDCAQNMIERIIKEDMASNKNLAMNSE